MSSVETPFIYNALAIRANVGDEELVDLRTGNPIIEYRESVFMPYVEVTAFIVDTGNTVPTDDGRQSSIGLLDAEIAQGTEEVFFSIEDEKGSRIDLPNLRLAQISNMKQSFQNQTYTLRAVSKEAFDNTLLENRCRSKYSGRISEIAKAIIRTNLKSNKKIDSDETLNEYHEWGDNKYPFELLLDIQKLSIPNIQVSDGKTAKGRTAGYLFWETSLGYNFKSLDKIFDTSGKTIKRFIENKKSDENVPASYDAKILWSCVDRSTDALAQFESGAWGSKIDTFDEVTGESKETELVSGENTVMAGKQLPKLAKDFIGKLTGLQFTATATGQTVKGTDDVEEQVEKTDEPKYVVEEIFQQAHQNYRQKMNMSVQIIVSADLDLHAGDLVYCEFEELSNKETTVGSNKRDSGFYMIADLCHHGTKTNSFTALHLVRDSYGVKSEDLTSFVSSGIVLENQYNEDE
mgnify:CR=1 FL=1